MTVLHSVLRLIRLATTRLALARVIKNGGAQAKMTQTKSNRLWPYERIHDPSLALGPCIVNPKKKPSITNHWDAFGSYGRWGIEAN